ncbi:ArsA family ATPase [Halovivax sp.]|uniref:ArsA family ATPase n=1 Tax=Halovivax sp. TaxID=1935978 RepID=UPI0025B90E15|nr:ArsA family ATPase [Halovivax sp.]
MVTTHPACILYGGKGGVGKTTCAAATGLASADRGRRTLVVSTDPAHSLSDAYGAELGPEPRRLRAGLWAVEIDPEARAGRYERIATALAADLRSAGISLSDAEVERIFAAGAPAGSDELAALDLFAEYAADERWDAVVFDTAPTGHTLRLFALPEVMGLALRTTGSLRDQARRIGTAARGMMFGPLAAAGRADGTDDLEALRDRLEGAREVLTDSERTAFRVVTIPESMAIAETERLVARLRAEEIPVRRIVVNRVLEAHDDDCARCRRRARRNEARVAEIRRTFPELEALTLPEAEADVHGVERLTGIADRLPLE